VAQSLPAAKVVGVAEVALELSDDVLSRQAWLRVGAGADAES
jgi:hypothetical protein